VTDLSQTVVSKKARRRRRRRKRDLIYILTGRVCCLTLRKKEEGITTYDVITRMGFHELSTVILLSAL
jgi:hypothetical protein